MRIERSSRVFYNPSQNSTIATTIGTVTLSVPEGEMASSRVATVTGVGRVLEPTVLSYAERLVVHERSHIKQIASIAGTVRG